MPRRGKNEGSIHQREDGRWVAIMQVGYEDQRRRRKYVYGTTRAEVRDKLTKLMRDKQQGLPVASEQETVGEFLTTWLENSAKSTVRPSTFASYASYVRGHLIPGLGRIRLARLTPQQVQSFLNGKLADGLTPRSVQYIRAILRRALGQALRWGLVGRNVAALVDPPKVRTSQVRPLTPNEARLLLRAVKGDRLEALYTVALAVGLRQGEVLGLRWSDVDLDTGTLAVRQALQRVEGKLTFVEPKTDRSRRVITMPAFAVVALREHASRQSLEREMAGARWEETRLVFTSAVGTPLDASNVTHTFQKVLQRAGLPRQRFHDLRHACASFLLAQGVSPRVVMETLGHSQISLTMNTYSHVLPSLQREAADRMHALLSDGS